MGAMGWFHKQQPSSGSFAPGCSVALMAARAAAAARREESVSTAHMVTGLLEGRDPGVVAMLTAAGIDATPAAARPLKGPVPEILFTRKAKHAMELAMAAAGSGTVHPGHLLLGVLREGGVGAKELKKAGATEEVFVAALREWAEKS